MFVPQNFLIIQLRKKTKLKSIDIGLEQFAMRIFDPSPMSITLTFVTNVVMKVISQNINYVSASPRYGLDVINVKNVI